MKKILSGALAFMLFAGVAQAQVKDSTARHHHMQGQEMAAKKLNLSADQQARLKSIHEQERKEMKALKDNTSLTAEQQKAQRAELHKKYQEQTLAIYTPEQRAQIEQFHKDRKAGMKQHGKGQQKEHMQQMHKNMDALNLTADQKQQMAKLREENRAAMESVRKDATLTQEQKKEKMNQLRKQQQERMKTILTAEQLQKMETMKKEHPVKTKK